MIDRVLSLRASLTLGSFTFKVVREWPRPFTKEVQQMGGRPVGAEVGVFKGENARSILRSTDTKRLFLVDPYDNSEYNRDPSDPARSELSGAEKMAVEAVKPYGDRVEWLRTTSVNAALSFDDEELDYVYIDALHTYDAVKEDIVAWWPKVRAGGLIGGHDWSHPEVARAVCEFATQKGLRLHAVVPDWWFYKPQEDGN